MRSGLNVNGTLFLFTLDQRNTLTHLTKNYTCGHIYHNFITTTHHYIVGIHLRFMNPCIAIQL